MEQPLLRLSINSNATAVIARRAATAPSLQAPEFPPRIPPPPSFKYSSSSSPFPPSCSFFGQIDNFHVESWAWTTEMQVPSGLRVCPPWETWVSIWNGTLCYKGGLKVEWEEKDSQKLSLGIPPQHFLPWLQKSCLGPKLEFQKRSKWRYFWNTPLFSRRYPGAVIKWPCPLPCHEARKLWSVLWHSISNDPTQIEKGL